MKKFEMTMEVVARSCAGFYMEPEYRSTSIDISESTYKAIKRAKKSRRNLVYFDCDDCVAFDEIQTLQEKHFARFSDDADFNEEHYYVDSCEYEKC